MSLTEQDKTAARLFRDQAQADLIATFEADPPTYTVPTFIALYRHLCASRGHKSVALELKEIYVVSPIYPEHGVPAGRFAFLYRQGRCRGCGQTARSRKGRLVDGWKRPPIFGRGARS